jgi:hypothetical protein
LATIYVKSRRSRSKKRKKRSVKGYGLINNGQGMPSTIMIMQKRFEVEFIVINSSFLPFIYLPAVRAFDSL